MDCGEPAVQGLLPGVWVEAALGEVDVDVDGAILLDALQEGQPEGRRRWSPSNSRSRQVSVYRALRVGSVAEWLRANTGARQTPVRTPAPHTMDA